MSFGLQSFGTFSFLSKESDEGQIEQIFPSKHVHHGQNGGKADGFFSSDEKMLRRGCQVKFFSSTEFRSKYSKISFLQMIPFFFRKYVILSDLMRQ